MFDRTWGKILAAAAHTVAECQGPIVVGRQEGELSEPPLGQIATSSSGGIYPAMPRNVSNGRYTSCGRKGIRKGHPEKSG